MKKILFIACILSLFSLVSKAQTLPAAYVQTTIMSGIPYACDFDWTPDGRILVTSKGGSSYPAVNALIRIYAATGTLIGTFYNLTDSVDADFERGLLGIAVDPDFAVNHYVYAYYDYRNPAQNKFAIRVVRFTELANIGTAPTLIFNQQYATSDATYPGNHFGGIIRIRPSEPTKLYIQIGDLANNASNPTLNHANKLDRPYGKILRINTDGTIPTDNPFYDDGNPTTGNDDRIWTYGNRNMYGMCFSPVTDTMYSAENGWNTWDEFNVVHKGGNYGWATCEGNYNNGSTSVPCSIAGTTVAPIQTWGTPLPSITGCVYYYGTAMPEFNNHILVADNDYGRIYDMTMGNAPYYDMVTSRTTFADIVSGTTGTGLTTLRQGQTDGCIYALKAGYASSGALYKICHTATGISSNEKFENSLGQNYPNPANGSTAIDFTVSASSYVLIDLFDMTGRKMKTICEQDVLAGKHTIYLDGLEKLANGNYFYKIEVKQENATVYSETRNLVLVK
jgi:glucose/arabinose dehydrogenase